MLPSTNTLPAIILLAKAPIRPAIPAETVTNGDALYFTATPTPIPAPVSEAHIFPIRINIVPIGLFPANFPICSMIKPIISVENNPHAIPVNPSIQICSNSFFPLFLITSNFSFIFFTSF